MSKSLFSYFKPLSKKEGEEQIDKVEAILPDPNGPLSQEVPALAIAEANKDVLTAMKYVEPKKKGPYIKISPEYKAKIAKYAIENGNCAAARKFGKSLEKPLNESTVRSWVVIYKKELEYKRKIGETVPDVSVLPQSKRGRPLLMPDKLDYQVRAYVRSVREAGGPVTTTIVMSTGRAIVNQHDPQLLAENGGPLQLTATWAKSLLHRMSYVKRKGCSVKKLQVIDFEGVKQQFLIDIRAVVTLEEIPKDLILNWDHTGLNIVPTSSWTMEEKGRKHVEIVALNDKRQITAVVCGTLNGHFLPMQLIYQGTTTACLPKTAFPKDWLLSYTPNHWSNEEKTLEYIQNIILPYLTAKKRELCLPESFPALAIFDFFKGQTTPGTYQLLEQNNIYPISIPANCTDKLQPMDLSVNKSLKDQLKTQFMEWYSSRVYANEADAEPTPVDLRLSIMKPLNARWILKAYNYIKENKSIVENGFKEAGITGILYK